MTYYKGTCLICGIRFPRRRYTKTTCSDTCRQALCRYRRDHHGRNPKNPLPAYKVTS